MGNRAVITTEENFRNNGVGIYLHWNGGRDSVEAFLKYCKMKGYRSPEKDCYGWAYLAATIANFFRDGLHLGVDVCSRLDCDNGDNGVYFIKDWEIVGRKYAPDQEKNLYNIESMLYAIDDSQPVHIMDKELESDESDLDDFMKVNAEVKG